MILVDSSSIYSVGYEGEVLSVRFKASMTPKKETPGKTYVYKNVPRIIYLGLIGATSTGKFFVQNVKGRYDCTIEENFI